MHLLLACSLLGAAAARAKHVAILCSISHAIHIPLVPGTSTDTDHDKICTARDGIGHVARYNFWTAKTPTNSSGTTGLELSISEKIPVPKLWN